jgi:hypothetical protein
MIRNFLAGTEPDPIVLADMIEKLDQPHSFGRAANETVVQRDGHHFRSLCAFFVQKVEAVDQVGGELVGRAKAVILVEAVVIGFEREGNHQMIAARMFHPERQFIAEVVAVIQEAAVLDHEPAGIVAGTAVEPSGGSFSGQGFDALDSQANMLALIAFADVVIVSQRQPWLTIS